MDFYKECLVEKVMTSSERMKKNAIWGVITFVLFALGFWGFILFNSIARIIFLILVALIVFDKFYFNKVLYKLSFKVEYEYTLTNTTLDIDKIVAQTDRTRMLSFEMKDIELMTPMSLIESREYDGTFKTVAEACADITDFENTYCIIADTEKYGRVRVVFTPNEGMLELMKTMLNRRFREKK